MRFSELDGATVGVWGAGREIRSFADQLARRLPSARIVAAVFDEEPESGVGGELRAPEARVVLAPEAVGALRGCEVVVRSPGVPAHRRELEELRAAGVHVTTATSLWLAEREGEGVIGVTGTKGKSTTAALIDHLLRATGLAPRLAGNIGVPALDLLDEEPGRVVVVELSSYQITDLETGPQVAVLTNLFREHLDWHGSEEAYRADKLRLFSLPGVRSVVVNSRDEGLAAGSVGRVTSYGQPAGWDVLAGGIARDGRPVVAADELPLRGEHNALNLCAALAAVEAFGVEPPALPGSLAGFAPLPHRLVTVAEIEGVTWVDDSISTTPESTLAALASFPDAEIVLIGGGQDRGQDYAALGRAIHERRAAVIGIPSTGPRLLGAAQGAGVSAARALAAE
ncbi:MAG TPA: UDP-N-acetylmuramoyl-L-alanine--D-glutamate ligase, partial [Solirubrobacteraceae bacterium]|nr:UDP-N-acetylmuramoyl-L-alanine--D-glutamate ligase [Solirubrobacteraceae bacterium]